MLWKIMVFFLLVIIFALLLKIFYMRKAIKEIKRGFSEKLYTDTNTPIMLSSYDKLVSSLANDINVELKELQKQFKLDFSKMISKIQENNNGH